MEAWRRSHRFRVIVKLGLSALVSSTLAAQHGYTPADVEDGQKLFAVTCAVCHGQEGVSVPGVDLGHGTFRRAASDDDLVRIIVLGIPGTAMPPSHLEDLRARTIVAYLQSMASSVLVSEPVPGDAARGKIIFEGKGNCTGCHRVRGNGSRVGPELTDIGLIRRAAELRLSILDPDAEILPQNRFIHMVTKDGKAFDGRLLNHDTYTIQLLDTQERLMTFQMSDIRQYQFAAKSSMPSYREKLSAGEIGDVVNYLVSLRGIEAK